MTECRCAERDHAERSGSFVRAPAVGAWVDLAPDRARRRDGFGYLFHDCPWCGEVLPVVPRQQPSGDTWTAHWGGDEGDE